MPVKSFVCIVDTLSASPVPGTGYETSGDSVIINASGALTQWECDPELSYLLGAAPTTLWMSESEFNELWPLLLVVMVIGYLAKRLRQAF